MLYIDVHKHTIVSGYSAKGKVIVIVITYPKENKIKI